MLAEGFAFTMPQSLGQGSNTFTWREQWLVVRSFKHQQRQQKALDQRLEKTTEALAKLNLTGRGHKRRSVDDTIAADQRVKGLIRLLSLGLRILCLLEFSVRSELDSTRQELSGLYAGNPKRATAKPTAELLLRAFRGITLTVMKINGTLQYFLSALSQRQQRILQLLRAADDIYLSLSG